MNQWLSASTRFCTAVASTAIGTVAIALSVVMPSLAGDPFQRATPRNIGANTEAAFNAVFQDGNYVQAEKYLQQAIASEPNEPMIYALLASFAYVEEDWEAFRTYGSQTLAKGEQLINTDPLRGNLYAGIGQFIEGAYIFQTEGAPQALGKLPKVFGYLSEAEQVDSTDPEYNLIRGYMDLLLAVNLPFADPEQAIARLLDYGRPLYIAHRGIALGYRDLEQPDDAAAYAEQARQAIPNNPDIWYLIAQIQSQQNNAYGSVLWFDITMDKRVQMLPNLAGEVTYEHCRALRRHDGMERDCRSIRNLYRECRQKPEAKTDPKVCDGIRAMPKQ